MLMVLIAYAPTLDAQLIWDDSENITANPTLRSWDGLRRMWFVPQSIQQYYPLMYTTYWVEYRLWGLSPRGYHLDNMLLHATAAVLLWRLLLRLAVPAAWFAAAIFALHPVQVESVAWVTERKNVLSLSLALAAMLWYLRFAPASPPAPSDASERDPAAARWGWYAAAFVTFALALLAKTVVLSVPAVLLVIYWWKRGRLSWRDVVPLIPWFALGLTLAAITLWMETHHVGARKRVVHDTGRPSAARRSGPVVLPGQTLLATSAGISLSPLGHRCPRPVAIRVSASRAECDCLAVAQSAQAGSARRWRPR